MDNVCRDCGRKFLSDLRFCPHCGGDAMPPATKSWHYQATGLIAHSDPETEEEVRAYRQNGWILLCLGILLIPVWLMGLDILLDELSYEEGPDPFWILVVILQTVLLTLIFIASFFAFSARRPGTQVMAALFIVVIVNAWHPIAWALMVGAMVLLIALWGKGRGSRSPSDPTYLPLISGLAILSVILAILALFTAPMGGM
jgi:hypothetical protein